MIRHVGFLALLLLLAACNEDTVPNIPPTAGSNPWVFQYSPNMPQQPAVDGAAGSYQFAFPAADGVHYLVQKRTLPIVGDMFIDLEIVGGGVLFGSDAAGQACGGPAHMGLYFQRLGDNFGGDQPNGRWFSTQRYDLSQIGSGSLAVPMDPAQWGNVFGKLGDDISTGMGTAFKETAAQPQAMGLTFGRGCFAGHGIYAQGQVTFKIRDFGLR